MENLERSLVGFVKTLIPWRSKRTNVSREFWMPGDSCNFCYDCEASFTIFNRRHHCRLCGRVFCARCTMNSVSFPFDSEDDSDHKRYVRVCNCCFRETEQQASNQITSTVKNELHGRSSSPSMVSLASSSRTNSFGTIGCLHSTMPHPRVTFNDSGRCFHQQIPVDQYKGETLTPRMIMDSILDDDPSVNQCRCHMNRGGNDRNYDVCCADSESQLYQSNHYNGQDESDEVEHGHCLHIAQSSQEGINSDLFPSMMNESVEYQTLIGCEKFLEVGSYNIYQSDPSSPAHNADETCPMFADFENNLVLWFPPSPADAVDEVVNLDDDDDEGDMGGDAGDFAYSHSTKSFGSCESYEKHRFVIKDVVVGHFRALVSQLLQAENLSICEENDKESWLEIVTSLSCEVATLLKPQMNEGEVDPGASAKIKCIACGHRSDSLVIRGVVCRKNLAHRHMKSRIEKPRLLLLGGALEYHRVSNQLSSFDTLRQQEMDHLKMAVAKIDAHHPNILLVEKTVSRFAQDYLLTKDISLVLNMKRPVLERVSLCTGAQIVSSVDHLSSQKLGNCDLFHVEKFLEESECARQKKQRKNLMFFEGCPKPFGCTILLMGADICELKKVKRVLQYGVFAAYHLALEISILADEGCAASLDDTPRVRDNMQGDDSVPTSDPSSVSGCVNKSKVKLADHFCNIHDYKSTDNYCFDCSKNDLKEPIPISTQVSNSHFSRMDFCDSSHNYLSGNTDYYGKETIRAADHVNKKHYLDSIVCNKDFKERDLHVRAVPQLAVKKNVEEKRDCELGTLLEKDACLQVQEVPHRPDLRTFSDHQSILVSLSTRCVWKGTVCEHAHLFRIKYYGSFDKPLGLYLREHLLEESYRCHSCEMPSDAHVHCYTHMQGSLTIAVRKIPVILAGKDEGKIWMWRSCLRCPQKDGRPPQTSRIIMSDAAWGLSFGKFLELSFSNHAAASRVASCGHSIHRDCLRFYGFGQMVACFRYASVDVHSVHLPSSILDFETHIQEWIQKEVDEATERAKVLFDGLLSDISQVSEKRLRTRLHDDNLDIEKKFREEKTEFEEYLKIVQSKQVKGPPFVDALGLNVLNRRLLLFSYLWDQRLIYACGLDSDSSEELNGAIMNNAEKFSPIKKLMPSKLQGFNSLDSIDMDIRNVDDLFKASFFSADQGRDYHSSSSSPSQMLDQSSGIGNRSLSDGQISVLSDFSDTFEAKWIGESVPVLNDHDKSVSSVAIERAYTLAELEGQLEENFVGGDLTKPTRIEYYTSVDCSSWIDKPFLSFFNGIYDKNVVIVSLFKNLYKYRPVFVSKFWRLHNELGARLVLPFGVTYPDIFIYDDEPSSIISYALSSEDYHLQLTKEREKRKSKNKHDATSFPSNDSRNPLSSFDDAFTDTICSSTNCDSSISSPGSRISAEMEPQTPIIVNAHHLRVSFRDEGPFGKVKYSVICYCAVQFDALRKICCPLEIDFVRSLSRCKRWGAQGGKSNVFFAKSKDDRFIIKQVTRTELESFMKFSSKYFKYLSESIKNRSPTCLAKILGIYQVTVKHMKGGRESKMDVLVMENLLYGRNITRVYDLKGSLRSRYNADSTGNNKVLLDENLIETLPTSPIFVENKAKRLLERAVWNDTSFLASVDVMDYSLLVGVDENRHELIVGVIDFMRKYTWDKHLETWVKASGILGGPKNSSPTVISPMQYKRRFRKAMADYFVMVPEQWTSSSIVVVPNSSSDFIDEDDTTLQNSPKS